MLGGLLKPLVDVLAAGLPGLGALAAKGGDAAEKILSNGSSRRSRRMPAASRAERQDQPGGDIPAGASRRLPGGAGCACATHRLPIAEARLAALEAMPGATAR